MPDRRDFLKLMALGSVGLTSGGAVTASSSAAGSGAARRGGARDGVTIVVFSRHTFRGTSASIGPEQISLSAFGIEVAAPVLSYAEDATPHGLVIAQQFASQGLVQAAAMAVEGLGESRVFDGRWDEIRADLSTQRTFFTALSLRNGLQAGNVAQRGQIMLTGCPTTEGKGVDAVTSPDLVDACIPKDSRAQLEAQSPNLDRLRIAGENLLNTVSAAIGGSGPVRIGLPSPIVDPATGALQPVYDEIGKLAGSIEMSAELGAPLQLLFKTAPLAGLAKFGRDALTQSVNFAGVNITAVIPMELAYATSAFPIQYINSSPAGRHTIVVSHDRFISSLGRALGIISDAGNVDALAFYPIESFVFAMTDTSVCVVRMRINSSSDGSIAGPYASSILGQGSRAQWNVLVQNAIQQANAWNVGAACRAGIQILTPQTLDVLVKPTGT